MTSSYNMMSFNTAEVGIDIVWTGVFNVKLTKIVEISIKKQTIC